MPEPIKPASPKNPHVQHRRQTHGLDEFLIWCLGQEERYKLIDGIPVEMMTGASGGMIALSST